jgi:uncharacterized protein (TIGR03437 family)
MNVRRVSAALLVLASSCFAGDAYFEMSAPPDKQTFVIRVAGATAIQKARDIVAGRETESVHVMGRIVAAPAFYNPSWSFHLDPGSISYFSMATEVCDGAPSEIAAHLSEVGGALLPNNRWCPWSSVLVREVSEPAQAANYITDVSAADYNGVALAAGSLVSAFGTALAAEPAAVQRSPLPETMGGVSVKVADSAGTARPAGLYYVSPEQVNYVLPEGTANGLATVTLTTSTGAAVSEKIFVQPVYPSLFTLGGVREGAPAGWIYRVRALKWFDSTSYEAIAKPDGTLIPIDLGPSTDSVYLSVLGTGIRSRPSLDAVRVSFTGSSAAALYAGPQAEMAGLDQINVLLPRELAGQGEILVTVSMEVGDRVVTSNAVRIAIQ